MPRRPALDNPQPLFDDYLAGSPVKDLAIKYGITDTTIQNYLKKYNIPRRDPWRPKRQRDRTAYIRTLVAKYGITEEDFFAMYKQQKGKCGICLNKIRVRNHAERGNLHVDHCHDTGKVRGLLCPSCNHGLGNFRDSDVLLARAVKYLRG